MEAGVEEAVAGVAQPGAEVVVVLGVSEAPEEDLEAEAADPAP